MASSPNQIVEHQSEIELTVDGHERTSTSANTPPSDTSKLLPHATYPATGRAIDKTLSSTNPTTGIAIDKTLSTANPITETAIDKTLSSTSNLAQLLPTGTVLAFESLSSSFTNNGTCYTSNRCLTAMLIYFCLISCVILTFTDSVMGQDGKLYHGIATFKSFYVFNFTGTNDEATQIFPDPQKLRNLRIRIIDYVHAFFTAVVFLAVAFSDTGVQNCFFKGSGKNTEELLVNFPLGAAVLSSFIFTIFPTTRKGIGFSNVTQHKSGSTESA